MFRFVWRRRAGIAAVSLSLLLAPMAAVSYGQNDTGGTIRVGTDDDDDGDSGMWGLAGLLGLAGLAGLMRRRDADHTRHREGNLP